MRIDPALQLAVERVIHLDALHLDERRFGDWLDLYTEDAEFWVPAWASEDALTTDPETELALIHIRGKAGLDDRVFRIGTRDSYASMPLPRTCHVVGNVLILSAGQAEVEAAASWTVHQYQDLKGPRTHGGRYRYRLRLEDGIWRIAAKTVIFLNDRVDVALDIYNV